MSRRDGKGHHEGGSDLNLRAGSDVRDRYHVEAAQEFFVENRRLAAVNRVLVGFAGLPDRRLATPVLRRRSSYVRRGRHPSAT